MITKKLQSKDGFVLNKKISSANFNFFKKHGYIVISVVNLDCLYWADITT